MRGIPFLQCFVCCYGNTGVLFRSLPIISIWQFLKKRRASSKTLLVMECHWSAQSENTLQSENANCIFCKASSTNMLILFLTNGLMNISLAYAVPAPLQMNVLIFNCQNAKEFEANTESSKCKTVRSQYDVFTKSLAN